MSRAFFGRSRRGASLAFAAALFLFPSKRIFSSPLPLSLSKRILSSPAVPAPAPVGLWHAALVPSEGHEVFFDLKIARKGAVLSAALVNDRAEFAFTSASWDGTELTLELANYDARIVAEVKSGRLEGGYKRVVAAGLAEVAFRATRKPRATVVAPKGGASLEGSWGVEMIDGRKTEKLTGVFRQKGSAVTGTFLSTTGDYGSLHGSFDGEQLVLTVFDGVHVYRFDAELLPDGTLAGEYRSRSNPPVPWRGRRLDAASQETYLPGSFDIVKARNPAAPYVVSFPDALGRIVSTSDARFSGKPMLVAFMGTWCPNCADEAPFLRDLEAKHGPRGLAVLSLTFEYTDEVERNRRQVKRFVERFGTTHPILLAGTTKDASASPATLPLEGWEGYPTTLFLDRQHRIVKIHSGFDGPATGERFTKLKKEIESVVETLLRTTN
ncbi:MAG: TlpA family protein disulfide reductase [Thermoanaerobaculia bacterium]|nr:TlpA family protein disulfide reductase [Thermoanaerobaculia bacterium]